MVVPISLARLEVAFSGYLTMPRAEDEIWRKTGGIISLCLKPLLGCS